MRHGSVADGNLMPEQNETLYPRTCKWRGGIRRGNNYDEDDDLVYMALVAGGGLCVEAMGARLPTFRRQAEVVRARMRRRRRGAHVPTSITTSENSPARGR